MRWPDIPRTPRWGVRLALATAAISGLAVWVNASGVRAVGDPALYTTLKNLVAASVLIGAAASMGGARDVRAMTRGQWWRLLVIGLVGGSIPFLLFFTGLAMATAPTAAFVHKTLFLWVGLLAVPLLGERFGLPQVGALSVLLAGQILLAWPLGAVGLGIAEVLIAGATLLWAVEVIVAKRLLGAVPPAVVGAGRLGIGVVVLLGYVVLTGRASGILDLSATAIAYVLVTGVILAGYVGTWLAALRRAPATIVTSVLVLGAIVTATLSALASGVAPASTSVLGLALVAVAGLTMAAAGGRATSRTRRLDPGALGTRP